MEEPEMQLKGKKVTDKFTESVYVLANEPSVALYRLQEHVRRSLPELAQHKADMQRWEEQSQGAIYTVEYACSTRASHCCGLSRCRAQAPDAQAQRPWLTGPAAPRHAGSSWTRARTCVPCIGRRTLNHCATREAQYPDFLTPSERRA
ncbi:BLOC-1-related complex subunit 8 isoform X1 [Mesoplodon densirostris]|uniref:BLOC-1-related complex subunit 8 isoform X1 n=1 Tax=Mesoplodon densirostris TaxID=48708 RepID=UPI0028DD2F63|nr:BLOC-1-related complex subunit 8 isoform X1 [Mesoplodon densirostris]